MIKRGCARFGWVDTYHCDWGAWGSWAVGPYWGGTQLTEIVPFRRSPKFSTGNAVPGYFVNPNPYQRERTETDIIEKVSPNS